MVSVHSTASGHVVRLPAENLALRIFISPRSEGLDHAEKASTRFMVTSGGVLSEGYGHDGPGVCLGDGQTEAYLKNMRVVVLGEYPVEVVGWSSI